MSGQGNPLPSTAQQAVLLEHLLSGQTLSCLLGHSLDSQEALYHLAYTYYGQARYADAMRMFAYLLTANHLDRRFYCGFAACLQMQRRHADALKYYGFASVMDLTDPKAPMHMAECHLALGDRAQARRSIAYALTQARARATHACLATRLEGMLAFLDTGPAATPGAKDETTTETHHDPANP